MHHLVDRAIRSSSDLSEIFQILCGEVPVLLRRDLQLPGRLDAVRPQPFSKTQTEESPLNTKKENQRPSSHTSDLYSHVWVLERKSGRVQRNSGSRFDRWIGEIQLEGFTFT